MTTLQAIEARLRNATPGPWAGLAATAEGGDQSDEYFIKAQPHPALRGFTKDIAMVEGEANATFIAHAPTDIAWLLSEHARLTARIAELEAGAQEKEHG